MRTRYRIIAAVLVLRSAAIGGAPACWADYLPLQSIIGDIDAAFRSLCAQSAPCGADAEIPPHKTYRTASPDGKLELVLHLGKTASYSVLREGKPVILESPLGLSTTESGDLAANPRVLETGNSERERTLHPPNPLWSSTITDHYRQTVVKLRSGLSLVARVSDDGVAIRLLVDRDGPLTITHETFGFRIDPDAEVSAPLVDCSTEAKDPDCFHSDFERLYPTMASKQIPLGKLSQLPVVIHSKNGWAALSEADGMAYPGGWLRAVPGGFAHEAAGAPKATTWAVNDKWKYLAVSEREPYVARYPDGHRKLPWRVIQVGQSEGDLVGRDFLSRLTDDCPQEATSQDWSWVKPGFGTDEWIIDSKLGLDSAKAGFVPGLNTATYKYYVDFAAKEGFRYIIVDDGWSDPNDMGKRNPNIDLPEIIRYAKEKGVGIMLWAQSSTVRKDLTGTLDLFRSLGVAGMEMDFNQRDDVEMLRFQRRVVQEAAKRHLLMSLHGSGKPTGLNVCYPNLLTVESGRGHEYNRGGTTVTPRHKLDLAFIRSLQGPFDYEGGSMNNVQPEDATGPVPNVEAQGTRANELAVSLIYPSAFQVIAGDLAAYEKDPKMMAFYEGIPTTWDETRVLKAEFGKLLVLARRKGNRWFLAGMSAESRPREVTLDLSFLPPGAELHEIKDGPDAGTDAKDYVADIQALGSARKRELTVHFARNGGWVARTAAATSGR